LGEIKMPINGISVGKDVVLTFNDNNGQIVTNRIKMFSSKQKISNRETAALDGINRHVNIPMGWEGSFEMERTSSVVDDYFANLENNYYAGGNLPTITLTETITEPNGGTSQYQYLGVVINLDSAGDWKAEDYITQKINFSAQQRKKVA
jgi:hypothetical protein